MVVLLRLIVSFVSEISARLLSELFLIRFDIFAFFVFAHLQY